MVRIGARPDSPASLVGCRRVGAGASLVGWATGVAAGAAAVVILFITVAATPPTFVIVAVAVPIMLYVFVVIMFYVMASAGIAAGVAAPPTPAAPNLVVSPLELRSRAATAGLTAVLNAAGLFGLLALGRRSWRLSRPRAGHSS